MTSNPMTSEKSFPDIQRATHRWALAHVMLSFVLLVMTFVLSNGDSSLQISILKTALLVTLVSSIVAVFLLFRGTLNFGLVILVTGIIFELFVISIFIEGIGFLTLLIMALATAFIVSPYLSQRQSGRLMATSIGVGILGFVSDVFLGASGFRFSISDNLQPFIAIVTVFLVLFVGFYIYRHFQGFSLRTKLIVSFVLVTVASLAMLGFLTNRNTRTALTNDASESLFAAAKQTEDSIFDMLDANTSSVATESQLPVFIEYLNLPSQEREGSQAETLVKETLATLAGKDVEHISSYALLDINGINLVDTDTRAVGTNNSEQGYFIQPIENSEAYVSDMLISPISGEASLYFSSPIISDKVMGVLRVRYDASILQDLLVRSNNLIGEDSFGVLFDEYFIHLAHGSAPETIFTTVTPLEDDIFEQLKKEGRLPDLPPEDLFHNLIELEEQLINTQASVEGVTFFEAEDVATGERRLQAVVLAFEDPPWLLVFFQPEDIFLAPAESQTQISVLLGIAISIGVVAVGVGLSRAISRPITELTEVAERISEGDLTAQSEISGNDEVAKLGSTINSMTNQLRVLVSNLEDQVNARTQDLEDQAGKLRAAAEIARDATSETELINLLTRAVNLIRSRFDFHYVGIYLVDERSENVYLHAGTGAMGEELLKGNHRIEIGAPGGIGTATRTGESQTEVFGNEENSTQSDWMPSDIQSQIVLPLKVGDEILGAIDMHNIREDIPDNNQVELLQSLADQLAIALQKTSLRAEVEDTLNELEAAYGEFSRTAWQKYTRSKKQPTGYRFDQKEISATTEQSSLAEQVWEQRQVMLQENQPEGESSLAVPMKIRGEVIGVLNLSFDTQKIPADSQALIKEVANRLGLVMENARLLDATQQRVEQERLLAEITSSMRETLDIDEILQTTVREIGEKLGIDEVEIRIVQISDEISLTESQEEQDIASPEMEQEEL